jgi:hypothetical protein
MRISISKKISRKKKNEDRLRGISIPEGKKRGSASAGSHPKDARKEKTVYLQDKIYSETYII